MMRFFTLVSLLSAIGASSSERTGCAAAERFRFVKVDDRSLALYEAEQPVLVYNHGVIHRDGVPADRARSTYVHPLYGLDGEVLTDDFPPDHHHHRGLFWAWPHVRIGEDHHDLWMLRGIEQRFVRLCECRSDDDGATLAVENGWYVDGRKVMAEHVRLRVHPTQRDARAIDVELGWTPLGRPIALAGAAGKSYGGLTLRFAPRAETVITTPAGRSRDDLPMTHLPWADLSARFEGRTQPSGAALFVSPDHSDYPPEWLTRHYGVLCIGWPGVEPRVLPPCRMQRLHYRVWIHRGAVDVPRIHAAYESYCRAVAADHGKR